MGEVWVKGKEVLSIMGNEREGEGTEQEYVLLQRSLTDESRNEKALISAAFLRKVKDLVCSPGQD